jgi:hypothetical protein
LTCETKKLIRITRSAEEVPSDALLKNCSYPRMSITGLWVAEAVETLSLIGSVRSVGDPERSEVLRRVTDAFLERSDVLFWWSHLKLPIETWQTENGYKHLQELVPHPENDTWLITGLTDDDKGLFECKPAIASAIIGECPGFEYALVDRAFKWMVIENHHDILIAVGDAALRLSRLRG